MVGRGECSLTRPAECPCGSAKAFCTETADALPILDRDVFSDQEKFTDATRHVEEAIKQAPDMAFGHYVAAYVLRDRNRLDEALPHIQESIRLDPYNSAAFGLLAQFHLSEKRHEEALQAAEQGLEVDSEDVHCQNLRAMALKNLGRHDDAADALKSALSKDPENSWTHANQGWALLEKNQHEEALKHFQEALRLDPENDWAREGIVLSLKSRYRIYAWMLRYFLWMGKLSSQHQWMVIIGMFFLLRMLGSYSRSHPEHAMFVEPVRTLIIAFAIMTWIADPLFNLALRLSKYGRLALTRDQVNASSIVGILLVFSLLFIILAYTVGPSGFYSLAALALASWLFPRLDLNLT